VIERGTAMTIHVDPPTERSIIDSIRESRDSMSARRVFGEPYSADGVTVIPVARVAGGGGGGGGEGPAGEGSGFGTGFGLGATPVGVYELRNGEVSWKPIVDVNRLARGGQVLAGIITVCVTLVLLRRNG
jgi:uncharacterized spore protein YtfJ